MIAPKHLPLLATFVQVCEQASFTVAAAKLGISKGQVSNHLRLLEEALGARLMERTTRRIALTQVGQDVLEAAQRVLSAAADVSKIAESKQEAATGVLRVSAPMDLGALLVAPTVARLCERHANLKAELVLSDHRLDPIAERLDAMVSVNVPQSSTLISTQLGTDFEIIVASTQVAKAWEHVKQPRELAAAPWVAHAAVPANNRYLFRHDLGSTQRLARAEARILANSSDSIRSLVVAGAGLAVVPSQMVREDIESGRMLRLLPEWRARRVRFHVCLPSRKHPPARVGLFVEELKTVFRIAGFAAEYAGGAPRHRLRYPPPLADRNDRSG